MLETVGKTAASKVTALDDILANIDNLSAEAYQISSTTSSIKERLYGPVPEEVSGVDEPKHEALIARINQSLQILGRHLQSAKDDLIGIGDAI